MILTSQLFHSAKTSLHQAKLLMTSPEFLSHPADLNSPEFIEWKKQLHDAEKHILIASCAMQEIVSRAEGNRPQELRP